jgi:hypothetical protein
MLKLRKAMSKEKSSKSGAKTLEELAGWCHNHG